MGLCLYNSSSSPIVRVVKLFRRLIFSLVVVSHPNSVPHQTNLGHFQLNGGGIIPEITDGNPPFQYSWTGPNGFTATTKDLNDLQTPGEYRLTVIDNCELTTQRCLEIPNRCDNCVGIVVGDPCLKGFAEFIGFTSQLPQSKDYHPVRRRLCPSLTPNRSINVKLQYTPSFCVYQSITL